jgi:hypothetical protein
MEAGRKDLKIEQGATFSLELLLKQADGSAYVLSAYTAKAQIRETYNGEKILDFVCTIQSEEDGILILSLTAATTATLINTEYVYDLIIESTTDVIRIIYGTINVSPSVTRDEPEVPEP